MTRVQHHWRLIARAAAAVTAISLGVRLATAVGEVLIARSLGRGDEADIFVTAFVVPLFLVNLIANSAQAALVPSLVGLLHRKRPDEAAKLLWTIFLLVTGALAIFAWVMFLSRGPITSAVGIAFSSWKKERLAEMFALALPLVLLAGMSTVLSGALNATERFKVAAIIPLVTPLLLVILAVTIAQSPESLPYFVGARVAGGLVEVVLLVSVLRKGPLRIRAAIAPISEVRPVVSRIIPTVAGALMMGSTTIVDTSVASTLAPGSVAALSYGGKMVGAVLAVGATGISGTILPYYSKLVAAEEWRECVRVLRAFACYSMLIGLPCALLLFVFADWMIAVLLQHGFFTKSDTQIVASVQRGFAFQVPLVLLNVVVVRLILALGRNYLLMIAAAINMIANLLLDILLARILGVAGIAWATTAVYLISTSFLAWRLLSREPLREHVC